MNHKIKIYLVCLFALFVVGCSDNKNIAESTNGIVDTNIQPTIVFTENVSDKINTLFDSHGEIKVNGKEFYGKYVFRKNNELSLIFDDILSANTAYKLEFDFNAINKNTNSHIKSKHFTMNFKTNELIVDVINGNFIKDTEILDKIKFESKVEISQEIPLENIKQYISLLDENNNAIDITITPLENKQFKITSTPLDSPQDRDQTYTFVFDKQIGLTKAIKIPIVATKSENLEIIDIQAIYGNKISIEIRFSDILEKNPNLNNFIKVSPNVKFSVSQANDMINISGNFEQDKEYTIEILQGIKSQNNLTFKENYTKSIKINDTAPRIVFANDGVFMPDSSNKKLAFRSVNVKKARITLQKVYANNITQFLQEQNLTKKSVNNFYDYRFEQMGDTIKEMTIDIHSPKNIWVQNEIDLSSLKDSTGIFIVGIHFDEEDVDYVFPSGTANWKKQNYFYDNGNVYKQLIFSNIALIAQKYFDGKDKKIIASAIDVRTNTPLSNVNIQAISGNNQIISSALTDRSGNAILDYDNDIHNGVFYISATANNGDSSDLTILKLSSQQISSDGFEVDGVASKNGIKAFIYTDRGVYRPGEKVNLTIIARSNNQALEHPIKLSITNPRNKKQVDNLSLQSLGDGVFYYEFETMKNADTGIYNVNVDIGDNIFTHKIAVESIVPNRIKVEINAQDSISLKQQNNIQLSLQSDYLFGMPASELEYHIETNVYPINFVSKKYKDWIFDNPTNLRYTYYDSFNGTLDDRGFAQRNITLNNINTINKNLEATITARVFENNGRAVSNRKKIALKVFDSFVGIKQPQTRYVKSGDTISLPIVLLDENENFIQNRTLKYTIYGNSYSWWWDYDDHNSFIQSLKSDKNTKILQEGEIISKNQITHLSFDVKEKGEILVEVRDTTNNQSASIFLYASSWGEPIDLEKISQLKIKANKSEYSHNETAKVTFESVKNGKALITISNNEEIIKRYWVDTNDLQTTIEVPIDKHYAPNLYVSVSLLQDYFANNNDRALRLYGVVPLKIIDESTKINLEIDTKDEILPNSELEVKLSNKEKKQVTYTLAIVDEGLINLTNFKTPSPWDYFYAKTKLGIQHYDTFDYIIAKSSGKIDKVYSIGGDEELLNAVDKQKGNENAERFKPVVFFVPPTQSDKNGEAKLSFKIPSYLGSLRVMLIAVDKNSYGSVSKDIRVSAPLVMLPTIPRSLKVGDKFKLPIEILPTKDGIKEATIHIKSDGIIDFDSNSKSIEFQSKKSKTIFFEGKVKEELGVENINLELKSKEFNMQDSTQIDIKAPNPYTLISQNYTIHANTALAIQAPKAFIKHSNKGKITLSTTPMLSIDHRLLWLIKYPYGCIEQTTSSVFPQLFIDKLSNADFIDKESIIANINAGIARIALFQTADGGFSYWQGSGESDKWGSSYAGHFLIMAKKQGYYVSEELLKRWFNYQIKNINYNDIYPLYLLALSDNPQLGLMNEVYENSLNKLSVTNRWLLAASYKLAGFDDIAQKITENLSIIPNENSQYYNYSYGSNLRNKAIILQAYKIINDKIHQDLYNEIKNELETNDWLSTQTISYALLVLSSIKEDAKSSKLEGKITLNGKSQNFNETKDKINFTLDSGEAIVESKQNLFANYTWEGITLDKAGDNIAQNMRLVREFVTIDEYGNESIFNPREIKNAQSFYIKLTLSGIDKDRNINLSNIALTQNLPSGWEIENTRLNSDILPTQVIKSNDSIDYIDIRDDKIMWFFSIYDTKVVYVKINAVTPGEYTLPPAYAEAMYNGSYQASTDSFRVKVNAK